MQKAPIKVFVRIRPGDEFFRYNDKAIFFTKKCGKVARYEFDEVFGPKCTQEQIFNKFKFIISNVIDGCNQTLFCYGGTGAGKTYTMVGDEDGLIYNLIKELLKYTDFSMSYMEIYNEKISDLLELREVSLREIDGNVVIPNLSSKKIETMKDFLEWFNLSIKNRATAETKLNKVSSRSHAVLRINVKNSKLHLIDLAGSENNRMTGNRGIRLVESNNINTSLFVLGKVVNAIIKRDKRIPYRDSKLTRLLQDSLGGYSLCYIIANIVDDKSVLNDSINTLNFASKSRKIINMNGNDIKVQRKPLSIKTNLKFNPYTDIKLNPVIRNDIVGSRAIEQINEETILCKMSRSKRPMRNNCNSVLIDIHKKDRKTFLKQRKSLEFKRKHKKAISEHKIDKKLSSQEILSILNSGNFSDIKKLPNIGNKRAQSIINFIEGDNFFESLDDLKLIFSKKTVKLILMSVVDYSTQ